MFHNNRYLTCGVDAEIPLPLQLFMWNCVESLPQERDYLQVFELSEKDGKQCVVHRSEQPEHCAEYLLTSDEPITEKIYIIDDGEHSTMLLASEYKKNNIKPNAALRGRLFSYIWFREVMTMDILDELVERFAITLDTELCYNSGYLKATALLHELSEELSTEKAAELDEIAASLTAVTFNAGVHSGLKLGARIAVGLIGSVK